jgi:hypothetical protein|nr:hypothetical protein MERC5_00016 [uncultured bacterium]
MNAITSVIKSAGELVFSLAVMLVLAAVALGAGEYTMPVLFALALMVPVTASLAVHTFRALKAVDLDRHAAA